MQESPEFERQQAEGTVPRQPLRHAIRFHRKAIGRGFAISALGSITYYIGITYVPAFLIQAGAMAEGQALWLATSAAVVVILVTPLVGALSDRFGRKPVLLILCGCALLLPAAAFELMATNSLAYALWGALILAALGGGVSAVGAVATAEQFPGEGRLSGLALGATAATAVFGGFAPYLTQRLMEQSDSPFIPGLMIAAVALGIFPILLAMPETRPLRPGAQNTKQE